MDTDHKQKNKKNKNARKNKSSSKKMINFKWIAIITVVSFVISSTLSYGSTIALENTEIWAAFIILLLFILFGIMFDVIGVASTAATEKQFHSMAAKKVKGAAQSVWLIRNADKVGSFCNDVIGDISGIISGATGTIIISKLASVERPLFTVAITLAITGMIASLTIGGKAIGKSFGIAYSTNIMFFAGKVIYYLTFRNIKKSGD